MSPTSSAISFKVFWASIPCIAKAAANSAVQTIRIEQAPLVIKAETPSKDSKYQM